MSIPPGNVSSLESTELRPQDVLVMVLRSAQFWELRSIRRQSCACKFANSVC